ncbi:MAG TPA: copper-containing nitrite reductase [Verrucomicrobiae bacterium]|nr:copper-containing nitrite reductase [Verrucomicrobiae bacterium]
MKKKLILIALAGSLAAILTSANAEPPHVKAEITFAPNVPPPITRHEPAVVEVTLHTTDKIMPLTSFANYHFWTFNGHVPGPFIRVRQDDWLQVTITNSDTHGMPHNVDFHAATGPGGGANLLTVAPGQSRTAWLKMREPGLFVYHCAVPPMIDHIANGMYGLILVEPTNGMRHADKEFYVMQGEFYTTDSSPGTNVFQYSHENALNDDARYVVFNGNSGAMTMDDALQANTGDRIRIFFGDAGPNYISSFHIIGAVMDEVYREGGMTDPPAHGLQTTLVTPGAAAIVEFTPVVPGTYTFIDHAASHSEKGAMGEIKVSGPAKADVYRAENDGPPK